VQAVRVFVAPRLRIIVRHCGLQEDNSVTAWTRIGSAAIAALLVVAPAAVRNDLARVAVAAERVLSDAQLKKINGWIAEKGRNVEVSEIITDILGLTPNNETMTTRAFATRDSENADEIQVIFILPAEKGYLEERFHQDRIEVYWADKNLVLISALTGIRGGQPAIMSFEEAKAGYDRDLKWWAKYAETN
jgi:hypothetical protein